MRITMRKRKMTPRDLAENQLWAKVRDQRASGRHITEEAIRAALASLEPGQREILTLVCVEGLSLRKAAQQLGISYTAAQERAARARVNLAARLGQDKQA